MTELSAGRPLERPPHRVGRRTITLFDPERADRQLSVELWYPAAGPKAPRTTYEVFPGAAFHSATAEHEAGAMAGTWPLVLFSHGRTGTRIAYSTLCEALAARGAIVASCEHPGDAMADWLVGDHSDDRTNEVNRVADAHLVLGALLRGHRAVPVDLLNAIHHDRVVLAGHSYGAFTAFATAAGSRGVAPHEHIRAVIGYQPYTRTMSDALLGRVSVPALLVVSGQDRVAPPRVDAERPWALLPGRPLWRLDLDEAGHQAASDVALYAELASHLPHLPDVVRAYLTHATDGADPVEGRTWRDLMRVQLDATWAFLQIVLNLDTDQGDDTVARLDELEGVALLRR